MSQTRKRIRHVNRKPKTSLLFQVGGRIMHRIFPPFVSGVGAIGLLVLRIVTGAAFIMHGWGKIQMGPFSWMGPEGPPAPIQALAVFAEFGGGIALVLGFLTPVAAFLIAGTMLVAL